MRLWMYWNGREYVHGSSTSAISNLTLGGVLWRCVLSVWKRKHATRGGEDAQFRLDCREVDAENLAKPRDKSK